MISGIDVAFVDTLGSRVAPYLGDHEASDSRSPHNPYHIKDRARACL